MDCRGQSYDNVFNMSGNYNGLNEKIIEINKYAIFVPCAAHSLDLVSKNEIEWNVKTTQPNMM